jgi:WD40 repeat protein
MKLMKTRIPFLVTIFIFLLTACSLPFRSVNESDVATIVAATVSAQKTVQSEPAATSEPVIIATETAEAGPTPLPPEMRRPEELRVVFIAPDRNLYTWSGSTGVVQLMDFRDAVDLKVSEDGQLIAFTRGSDTNEKSLWITGFDGSNLREVMSWNNLVSLKTNPESLGTSPVNLRWIPGTHILTFSTHEIFDGPGLLVNDDLISVDGDSGNWIVKFPPGQAGIITFSPAGNWMAVSTAERVFITDVNGNESPAGTLSFEPVITYSEYRYYPSVQWSPDGGKLAVVIPPADPLAEPRQPATIWTMDIQGGDPVLQSQVIPQFIGPVSVSPNLDKLFYVREFGQPAENRREIRTAQINGQNEFTVFTGGFPTIWDWNPNSEVFAYQTDPGAAVTVSQMNGSVGNLPGTNDTNWFAWTDSTQYLFTKNSGANVELHLGIWGEGSQLIAALPKSDMFRMQVDFAR